MLFGLVLAVSLAASVVCGEEPPAKSAGNGLFVHLRAWEPKPFADLVLDNPDLAACFLLAQGWWESAAVPRATPEPAALEEAVAEQLGGESQLKPSAPLAVYLAVSERNATAAMAHGDTILVMAPKGESATVTELARAIAAARLLASFQPAPPDPRCTEPLLALGEAIARAGALTLAELPPSLRPVKAWVDEEELVPAFATLVDESLDGRSPWAERKAVLATLSQLGGAGPRVANLAALLVEAFGDPARALRAPLDFLLAWRARANKDLPAMPHDLQRALRTPLEVGLPKEKKKTERAAIAADALVRRVTRGTAELADVDNEAPEPLRLLLAASARAKGNAGLCSWLTAAPLTTSRSGCRSEGEEAGIVFARPRAGTGFDVVWRSPNGDEALLLSWPRWLLFPAVIAGPGELCFVDAEGLWRWRGQGQPERIGSGLTPGPG